MLQTAAVVIALSSVWGVRSLARPDEPAGGGGDAGGAPGSAGVTTWFRADFSDLNASGSKLYNFANRYPQSAMSNGGGSLGFDYSYMGWTPPAGIWHRFSDWGLPTDFHQPPVVGRYASFQSNVNIGWSCNAGVLVTAQDHAAPVPKPQATGSAAADGWTHLQFEAVSGPDGQADFRTWANAPLQAAPSSERLDMPDGLGVTGWQAGANVVGYWGTADMPDLGFILDDFEMGPTFDPNWAP